jgi:hypothetical protein
VISTEVGSSEAVRGAAVTALDDLALTGYMIPRLMPVDRNVVYELTRETP